MYLEWHRGLRQEGNRGGVKQPQDVEEDFLVPEQAGQKLALLPLHALLQQRQMLLQPPDLLPLDPGDLTVPVHVPANTSSPRYCQPSLQDSSRDGQGPFRKGCQGRDQGFEGRVRG